MALNFPDNPPDGTSYEDDCGNEWIYNAEDNSWAILPPQLNPDMIWKYEAGEIKPVDLNVQVNMGAQSSEINLADFPETN